MKRGLVSKSYTMIQQELPNKCVRVHSYNANDLQAAAAATAAMLLKSCPTLCDHIDGSPPGSPIPGILQAD